QRIHLLPVLASHLRLRDVTVSSRSRKRLILVNLSTRIAGWLRSVLVARPVPRSFLAAPRDRRRTAAVSLQIGIALAVLLQAALGVVAEVSLYVRDPSYSDKE